MEPWTIGAVTLYPFGAVLALALAAGAVWSMKTAGDGKERKALELFWLLALPLGLFLAHLGWALCSLDMIEDEFGEILMSFSGGGYLLYGALAGAAAALGISCRVYGVSFPRTADRLAGPFLLLGAACAAGEGIIGGGYGWKVEDWFLAENSMSLFNEKSRADLKDRHILMAEDVLINAEIMEQIIMVRGAGIDHAENGKIVLDMFSKSEEGYYDAILMDVRMPEMDGLAATEAIRALDRPDAKKIPIIAMTANAFDEDVQRSLQVGMNAHLSKPVEPDRLYQTLEELIWEYDQAKNNKAE